MINPNAFMLTLYSPLFDYLRLVGIVEVHLLVRPALFDNIGFLDDYKTKVTLRTYSLNLKMPKVCFHTVWS